MESIKELGRTEVFALLAVSAAAGELGCAPAAPEELRESEQLLATGFGTSDTRFLEPWESPGEVDVCFVAPSGESGNSLYVDGKQTVEDSIEATWEKVTGLDFVFHDDCPSEIEAEWISVFLDPTQNRWGKGAYAGVGARFNESYLGTQGWADFSPFVENRTDIQVYIAAGSATPNLPLIAVHEIGHTLGFYHEMERIENEGCVDSNNVTHVGTNSSGHLTIYDEDSVMSLCSSRDNSNPLSGLDRLGAEMLYPKADPLPVACAERCMLSGIGVILREDGIAVNSWTARGALDWWDTDLLWKRDSFTVAMGAEFDATVAAVGDHELNYSAVSKFTGDTIVGAGLVEISDAKWTAVAMSAL